MRIKNTLYSMLLNGDVLNLSVKIIKDMLGLVQIQMQSTLIKQSPTTWLMSVLLKIALTRLVIIVLMVLQKEPLDTGFVILIWRKFSRLLIRSWKNNAFKTVENLWFSGNQIVDFESITRESFDICYRFCFHTILWKGIEQRRHNTNQTQTEDHLVLCLRFHIFDINE